MTAFVDIKEKIVGEKLDRITSWLAIIVNGDTKQFTPSVLLAEGVLSEQSKRFLLADTRFTTIDNIDIPSARILVTDSYLKELEYLLKPQSFLSEYLSGTSALDIQSKVGVLHAYEYYPIIISQRLNHKTHVTDITGIIRDIDDLVMSHATLSITIELLDEIYSAIRYRGPDPALEVELLSEYFRDKHVTIVADAFLASTKRELTLKESVDVLSALLVKKEPAEQTPISETALDTEYTNVSVPEYVEFVEELKEAGVQVVPFHLSFKEKKLLPLELFLSQKSQDRIIKDIFHGHEKKYRSFIATINTATDKEVARINLDTTLEMQRADRASKPARKLSEALDKRYSE
ncbi:MAG TPA: hypothetical protein VIX80_00175 [Candidatus Kapabacteria bacterium]